MKKKLLFIIGGIILLFIITNPSPSALKDHLGVKSTLGIERKYNFFLFSYYRYDENYIGVAGNFIEVDTVRVVNTKDPLGLQHSLDSVNSVNK